MSDHRTVGVKVGPFIVANTTERKPAQDQTLFTKWVIWAVSIFFIALASPVAGFVLVLGTAIYWAGHTAPTSSDQRKTDERTAR